LSHGPPTGDPKRKLFAVRLSARHLAALNRRAQAENITISEALRRIVDEWARGYERARPPTAAEKATFKLLAKAFGARTGVRRR